MTLGDCVPDKKVVIELPDRAKGGDLFDTGALPEREALDAIAEIIEIESGSRAAFLQAASDADGIIITWGISITREVIEKLDRCAVIGVASVGVDMVDVAAATERGIVVTNVPDVFIEEVADHTMMLLLASARRLPQTQAMAAGAQWNKGWPWLSRTRRLWGQTLGLVSFGNVARAVARRAKVFGLHVIAHDPYVSEPQDDRRGRRTGFIDGTAGTFRLRFVAPAVQRRDPPHDDHGALPGHGRIPPS